MRRVMCLGVGRATASRKGCVLGSVRMQRDLYMMA